MDFHSPRGSVVKQVVKMVPPGPPRSQELPGPQCGQGPRGSPAGPLGPQRPPGLIRLAGPLGPPGPQEPSRPPGHLEPGPPGTSGPTTVIVNMDNVIVLNEVKTEVIKTEPIDQN